MIRRLWSAIFDRRDPRPDLDAAVARCEGEARTLRTRVRAWERRDRRLAQRLERAHGADRTLEVEALWHEWKRHRESGERLSERLRDLALEHEVLARAVESLERSDRQTDEGARTDSREWWTRIERAGLLERNVLERERDESRRERLESILTDLGGEPDRHGESPPELLTLLSDLERRRRRESRRADATDGTSEAAPIGADRGIA